MKNADLILQNASNIKKIIDESLSVDKLTESSEEPTENDYILISINVGNSYETRKINPLIFKNSLGKYINTNLAPETIGGFLTGEPITPIGGLNDEEFKNKFFSDITLPSISFNVNNQIIEKGADFSQTININFSQNDAGTLIGYSLEKDGTEVSTTQSTAFTANNVIQNFTLQAFVSHDAGDLISVGVISTELTTITQVVPQWKGQKSNNTSLDSSTYSALNSALTKIIQNEDNTSITVTAGNYGFFISTNPNAKIIEDGTGSVIASSAFTKNTITAKLANNSNVTLTEYIINPATGNFTYNLQ